MSKRVLILGKDPLGKAKYANVTERGDLRVQLSGAVMAKDSATGNPVELTAIQDPVTSRWYLGLVDAAPHALEETNGIKYYNTKSVNEISRITKTIEIRQSSAEFVKIDTSKFSRVLLQIRNTLKSEGSAVSVCCALRLVSDWTTNVFDTETSTWVDTAYSPALVTIPGSGAVFVMNTHPLWAHLNSIGGVEITLRLQTENVVPDEGSLDILVDGVPL